MTWIPLFLDPRGLRVSVLGGGLVGERRALMFARAGARVRVYSLDFSDGLKDAASRGVVELVRVDLRDSGALREAVGWGDIVVVATGVREIDEAAARLAREAGKLVNAASNASLGNLVVPHYRATSYGLHVAVTSLGATGVAARHAADACLELLESTYYRTLYEAMSRLKEWLKKHVADHRLRLKLYFVADAEESVHDYARKGMAEEAFRAALAAVVRVLEGGGYPGGEEVPASGEKGQVHGRSGRGP